MIEKTKIKAELREPGRKGVLNQMRKSGRVPAVLYGNQFNPVLFSVNSKEIKTVLKKEGLNTLMQLDLQGTKEKEPLVVMVKDLQTDVVSHDIIHLDFLKLDMKEKVTISIPIRLTRKAPRLELIFKAVMAMPGWEKKRALMEAAGTPEACGELWEIGRASCRERV